MSNTVQKIELPRDIRELPGSEELDLLRQMTEKNDLAGLPAFVYRLADGRIVGIAAVDPDGYPLFAKLWCMEVAPKFRNRGIGSLLLHEVLNEYDEVKLVAMRQAFDFYKRNGFVFEYGEEPDPRSNVGYMVSRG
jgi:ribosomal protein S18 acetylase RimI-like enzyme